MSALGLLFGTSRLVVGVDDDRETGGVRVYVDARYLNRYSLIVAPDMAERCRTLWRGSSHQHLVADFQDLWPLHDEGRHASVTEAVGGDLPGDGVAATSRAHSAPGSPVGPGDVAGGAS